MEIKKNITFALTFDLDWAPDCAIELTLNILKKAKAKGTFFTTHFTDLNQEIINQGHTLGIHPNFLHNSSHGKDTYKIIEKCLKYAPDAWCIRTHSLYQSSPLLYEIFKNFSQLKLDISLFMHKAKYIQKVECKFNDIQFARILYNWEDDAEFVDQCFSKEDKMFYGESNIFNFHPMHIFLNSLDGSKYLALKKSLNGKKLQNINKNYLNKFCNKDIGVRSFLISILNSKAKSKTIEEIL